MTFAYVDFTIIVCENFCLKIDSFAVWPLMRSHFNAKAVAMENYLA